jgi:hypothetical protein
MRTVRGHKPGALGDRDIAAYVDTRTQHHKVFQSRISCNSRLSNQQTVTSDADIVTDLNQIVDLGTFANHGIADGAAVDGGASPNLDVVLDDDAPDLRHIAGATSRLMERGMAPLCAEPNQTAAIFFLRRPSTVNA